MQRLVRLYASSLLAAKSGIVYALVMLGFGYIIRVGAELSPSVATMMNRV